MISEEFGDSAQGRAEELKRQLDIVNRQIANIVDAIKTSRRFSEAMNQTLADLETQRDAIRNTLGEADKRVHQRIGAETLAEKIMAYLGSSIGFGVTDLPLRSARTCSAAMSIRSTSATRPRTSKPKYGSTKCQSRKSK